MLRSIAKLILIREHSVVLTLLVCVGWAIGPLTISAQQTTAASTSQGQAQQPPANADQPQQKKNKKKKQSDSAGAATPVGPRKFDVDYSKLVWPGPPSLPRVKYVEYLTGEKIDYTPAPGKKQKQGWMDRVAGTQTQTEKFNPKTFPFQMIGPYGMAVDSKGLLYVADQRVGAIFVFNTETKDTELIGNGGDVHFGWINGVAIDDSDRLFVSDGKKRRIIIFNPKRAIEGQITDGIVDPVGLAIDNENRFLYVADTQQDQVLVYDADTLKLLHRIGTGGKNHTLTTPGDFAAPQGVAVDKEGNLYVTDTLNDRVEIFDADGQILSAHLGRMVMVPLILYNYKGIAVDGDGHIWVADTVQALLKVFNREGQLLTYIGSNQGEMPGNSKCWWE